MKGILLLVAGVFAICNGALTGSQWQGVREELPLRQLRLNALKARAPAAPAASGSGIVMVADKLADVATAYQTLAHLRDTGVTAPAELWVADADITPAATAEFASLGVSLRDLSAVASAEQLALRDGKRPQALAAAVAHSAFETVLYLDVANAAADADALLAHPALASAGLVFWPTQDKTSAENPIWELVGAAPANADSFQQGVTQMLISKSKAWSALHLASHLATPFYGLMLNGNVDAVRMAALAAKSEFFMETETVAAPAPARALPAAIQEFVRVQACTRPSAADIKTWAALNTINIEQEFKGFANGTKKTFTFAQAKLKAACKVFALGGKCDGTMITQDKNLDVAFVKITMGGKDARLRFHHQGIDGMGLYQNYSIIQAGNWDASTDDDFWCDAKGFFYTSVEKNDGEPNGDFLFMAAYDLAEETDQSYPTGKLTTHHIEIVWNAGVLARPSFWLMVLAFALAAAMRYPY